MQVLVSEDQVTLVSTLVFRVRSRVSVLQVHVSEYTALKLELFHKAIDDMSQSVNCNVMRVSRQKLSLASRQQECCLILEVVMPRLGLAPSSHYCLSLASVLIASPALPRLEVSELRSTK